MQMVLLMQLKLIGTSGDNACAENFYSIFKAECLYLEQLRTIAGPYRLIDNFILFLTTII